MGDEYKGDAEVALQGFEFNLHLLAELQVKGAQGLIKQQDFGFIDEGAGQRHALPLAAGQLRGAAAAETSQRHQGQRFLGLAVARCLVDAFDHQAVGHIIKHGHVGEKRVVLKDRIHVALIGRNTFRGDAEDFHVAGGGLLEARNEPEAGGFAGPGRAQAWRRIRPRRYRVSHRPRRARGRNSG